MQKKLSKDEIPVYSFCNSKCLYYTTINTFREIPCSQCILNTNLIKCFRNYHTEFDSPHNTDKA